MIIRHKDKEGEEKCKLRVKGIRIYLLVGASCFAALNAQAQGADAYSPVVNISYPSKVYWGDTHVHTNLSMDAYNFGNRTLGPEDAYRFAKGEAVKAKNGLNARLSRPLDFLVVADHASNMGVMQGIEAKDPDLLKSPIAKEWSKRLKAIKESGDMDSYESIQEFMALFREGFRSGAAGSSRYQKGVWDRIIQAAEKHNQPGEFTAFIGYEWTQYIYNLHRVVIFKDGEKKTSEIRPFSIFDSQNLQDFWHYLQAYENKTGGEVLAIPHNGNLSSGVMFALQDADGNPLSVEFADQRSRWEPLFEVTQIKGDSEAWPSLSPVDEFADYENLASARPEKDAFSEITKNEFKLTDYDSWIKRNNSGDKKDWMRQYEYARPALKLGLAQQKKLGVNPFKFGLIGSTDSHTSLATADDNNFWGKSSLVEPYEGRLKGTWAGKSIPAGSPGISGFGEQAWRMNAAGYAAIWAQENTRESLFAAMKRKEVYASTGPRITVRFFGGWDYNKADAFKPDLARIGYEKGVPMGGDLTAAPDNKPPTFLIRAMKDPDGANLDRIQVIKGWHDANGDLHEKIYNVALSDNRVDKGPDTEKVGNTVDIPDASYINTIGDPELAVVWADPDFDKDELAFYYLRVLEIPTPRWTAYDAKYFQLKEIPEEVPMITQERAYSSPIWYTPATL